MNNAPLKVAIIAGEVSGDLLGADLVAALRLQTTRPLELVGVGGDGLEAQGLKSLYDFSELSLMGFTQVIAKLPRLIALIGETAKAIIAARPDVLVIIDSPDFTHRVAKRVRKALPDLPIVQYVCPSVWAWKEYRATAMLAYVDHVLAVLPFEPEVMKRLGGPPTTYVGHRLVTDAGLVDARQQRAIRPPLDQADTRTILLLPGSRSSEINHLIPFFRRTVDELSRRNKNMRFVTPTVARREDLVRKLVADWEIKPEIVVGTGAKWQAFASADAAMAASGTVILELGLTGVPVISTYSTDFIVKLLHKRIKTWTAALPNLIADYVIVPEQINEMLLPGLLSRWLERLSSDTQQRRAMIEGFDLVWHRMQTEIPPGEKAASIVLEVLDNKKPAHS
ncbi:lipid-A-disaccharide synthase [Rhizobium sp. VS19-DR104.2]|uniref:lipid-A-disaccharide synthase n=1 Tax=unclassified Rhizobium TaxID=2613769 RepID=UPI001C5A7E6D|nr:MULTISPECIES: lipid-A-disaccharide synthase [unclassified Rhizobium]MBZ5761485.1 lipid-A-disaccharide synthase [Rhizobium sp. VS19-DR96]MBZ5767433.1 lipid-A-disaccharide synthase [Rhizobium sp. VS19-DR129.2]MBZ5775118.1 lipid-A-disaccharide synthase [Rhizobium sp. VS19-DRK62.2]MBZ5785917.1 lipid-A-disaccharide synthase [Rhizobium sp. VS19-DR121]MBZ5803343.1 lipid-A-disaccharide synthase [Rhizobium sp. VS19-DR181]